jgi:hypothetical protein
LESLRDLLGCKFVLARLSQGPKEALRCSRQELLVPAKDQSGSLIRSILEYSFLLAAARYLDAKSIP